MGFFSEVVGAIGCAVSAIGSAFVSGVSSICSTIGGAFFGGAGGIAELATAIVGPMIGAPEISILLAAVRAVAEIVCAIAENLGIKEKEETPEELGMKAEEAKKKPEDFDSAQQYIEYLRKEVEIDQKKVETLSEEDRARYAAIGTGIYIKGIEERYGIKAPGEFWRTMADRHLSGEAVASCLDAFKEDGIGDMSDLSDYLKGQAPKSGMEPERVSDSMIRAIRNLYPGISEEEAYQKLAEM